MKKFVMIGCFVLVFGAAGTVLLLSSQAVVNRNTSKHFAQAILSNSNITYWTTSTGNTRSILEFTRQNGNAYTTCTNGTVPGASGNPLRKYTEIDSNMLRFIYEVGSGGHRVMVTAITDKCHSKNSEHYFGRAVDIDNFSRSKSDIKAIAAKYGGRYLEEGSHLHISFPGGTPPPNNPQPLSRVQGYKVIGTGNSLMTKVSAEIANIHVTRVDGGAVSGGNMRNTNPYFFHDIARNQYRFALENVPSHWKVGYTLCYDRTDCHRGKVSSMQAWGKYAHTVYVDTRNRTFADLWFHFTPASMKTSLNVEVRGAPEGRQLTIQSGPRYFDCQDTNKCPARSVGDCGLSVKVVANKNKICNGYWIGDLSISAPSIPGYRHKWQGCDATSPSGFSCWIGIYSGYRKNIRLQYSR